MEPRRLGQILVAEGLISEDQLEQAIRDNKGNGVPFVHSLISLEFIEETALANFLAHQFGMETVDLSSIKINTALRTFVPGEIAKRYRLIPFEMSKDDKEGAAATGGLILKLATENPGDIDQDEIRRALRASSQTTIKYYVASASQIGEVLNKVYPVGASGQRASVPGRAGDITTVEEALDDSLKGEITQAKDPEMEVLDPNQLIQQMSDSVSVAMDEIETEEYSVEAASQAPVIRICNYLISEAVKRRASDIHVNPTGKGVVIRYRIDGTLQIMPSPPPQYKRGIIARFKVMAKMNITERRKPQDGRIKIRVHEKVIDLRVSVIPQMDGENIVMRILDQSSLNLDLKKLGFEPGELEIYNEAIRAPYGMILHTGPTGSGKTTTLYSAISTLYNPKRCFITLEDPVEYEMPGIIQIQMDHDVGLDFATALRSALRHDPNVMMVGEIRDKETAKIAISAALTGHLLFSTLHTNDAPSTITRLIDIGIEPVYVGTAVRLIIAQRLMRRLCENCRNGYTPNEEELKLLGIKQEQIEGGTFYKPVGCPRCNMSGYRGRVAVYEIMRNTPEIQELIYRGTDTMGIREMAEGQGMRPLRELAISKWKNGITTCDEIQRVTMGGD